ncbi:alpha/beta hydrolase [Skermanella mucosa]|uniref:alpha/beta fold hydrolase n=1 Tax=Skermanella mucosa TaxID=1789672 RepID=UPI00192B3F1E|nr:alpha/beta hydrolase [Skermanella mucosa]UEM21238.1 alpha/beta hydrolase [Skermanella mucosa]
MQRTNLTQDTIHLPDGRRLGYAEYGDPEAPPVIYCHGFPSCRLEPGMVEISGIRLVALDRPGYGLSDPKPGRRLVDWPADVAAAADALGIERFAVAGVSGGAPYAAACAALLRGRVTGLALICGIAPPNMGWEAGGAAAQLMILDRLPGSAALAAALGRRLVLGLRSASLLRTLLRFGRLPDADRRVLAGRVGIHVLDSFREALRNGPQGALDDARIFAQPWDFTVEDISVPTVIWHGDLDNQVPVAAAEVYARLISHAQLCIKDGEGHFSLVVQYNRKIITSLFAIAERYVLTDVTSAARTFPPAGG